MLELIKAYGPRLAYSAILLSLVIVLMREVVQVWTDRRIYMGGFEYLVDTATPGADGGQAFAAKVQNQQRVLAYMLAEERDRREIERQRQEQLADTEIGNNLPPVPDLLPNAKNALEGIEIKVQGFDIAAITAKLRSWISPRNEITGTVEVESKSVVPSVNWPLPFKPAEAATPQFFRGAPEATETDAAYQLAAAIVWAQVVSDPDNKPDAQPFATRADFVAWARAWRLYRQVKAALAAGNPPEGEAATVKKAMTILEGPRARPDAYPEILRLYTDLAALAAPTQAPVDVADTAELVDRYKQAAAETAGGASVNVVSAATARTTTSAAAARPMVRPGVLLWDSEGRSAVTVGAIVQDGNGVPYAVIPAYMLDVTSRDEVTLLLGRGGPPVAVARKADVLKAAGDAYGGVVLARLRDDAGGDNELPTGGRLSAFGPPPDPGAVLRVATDRGLAPVTVAAVEPHLIKVPEGATRPGDGGAPVLDAKGRLVAFAYVKGGFLPVGDLARGYPLAQGVRAAVAQRRRPSPPAPEARPTLE